jgi:hypothetical protein
MAVSRYDLRKSFEAQEANAIGTEYARVDLLGAADARKVHGLLGSYVAQRIAFFDADTPERLQRANVEGARLQTELWATVVRAQSGLEPPLKAYVLGGMNDVLNMQGFTQAAFWNRIPYTVWMLLIALAIFCSTMVGYIVRGGKAPVLLIFPLIVCISLFLIADIDNPRNGLIRVRPQNLIGVTQSLLSAPSR